MASASSSRLARQLFELALRTATTREALERAIAEHAPRMTPADSAAARAALERRAAEISPTQGTPS